MLNARGVLVGWMGGEIDDFGLSIVEREVGIWRDVFCLVGDYLDMEEYFFVFCLKIIVIAVVASTL